MLKDLLEANQCFKLVCGAGNEDCEEVEKLVYIYSLAGCKFFDVCANEKVIDSAINGLKKSNQKDCSICISVGIEGDPHISKALIDENKCIKCGKCKEICIHDAIKNENGKFYVNQQRCLGCGQCIKNCPQNAISSETKLLKYEDALPKLISKGIDCIEFHAISKHEKDVLDKWNTLNKIFDKTLCISIDRSTSGDKDLVELVRKMISIRKPFTTIIQADGVAMSGSNDEYGTTLQAVATAQLFQNAKIPAYIMMSGGTNTKSTKLAKLCDVHPHCIAVGSYARKIIKDYLNSKDFWNNQKKIDEAIKIAKNLIDVSLENMKND